MNCIHCDRPAHSICSFCGRAVCREHIKILPHIEALYKGEKDIQKALVVADAVHCGICHPREYPVDLPELK
jgi:hypothetical protein